MAWIKVDISLERHPKTIRLAKALGLTSRQAKHLLIDLWGWSRDFAETGFVGRWEPWEVCQGIGYDGDPKSFLEALFESGFIKDGRWLNDWPTWGGAELLARIEKNRSIYEKKYAEMLEHYELLGHSRPKVGTEREREREKERDSKDVGFAAKETISQVYDDWVTAMREKGFSIK